MGFAVVTILSFRFLFRPDRTGADHQGQVKAGGRPGELHRRS
ncbi:hypothetical protein SM11_chr0744 [Sinorhizobium meliloti SM11]|uniref:Uncharacterized protein n=1 Tax=Sinorhizobium meliloti (strain SM11) TaxID=707241 RepID=F7X0N6_SINMM|nr:hypothetical protein SM11_chr0744 [Sinorhizobium meliloti SM11]